ncbi:type II toxin-antitoxin system VapC family toxin [Stenotrophomonas maltophilia]|uniref:type II toxin-antitoxin system VapC family toxin n=1 Tax=Stenotrophomonas maltophilia TaxID=40324 RepID=UPI0039C254B3
MSGKALVYWDSCAFIALLKGEMSHGLNVSQALVSQAGAFDRGQITLATSTVGIGEVVAANLNGDVADRFESMIRRKNFLPVAVNESIARDAARLRSHCYQRAKAHATGEPHILTMPDAIHVVTAMRLEADVLITLDINNKNVEVKRRELGMAEVSRFYPVPDLHSISIQLPTLGQPGTELF